MNWQGSVHYLPLCRVQRLGKQKITLFASARLHQNTVKGVVR